MTYYTYLSFLNSDRPLQDHPRPCHDPELRMTLDYLGYPACTWDPYLLLTGEALGRSGPRTIGSSSSLPSMFCQTLASEGEAAERTEVLSCPVGPGTVSPASSGPRPLGWLHPKWAVLALPSMVTFSSLHSLCQPQSSLTHFYRA